MYTYAVDIWSCGCIFAELLGRNPIFPGKNFVHQLSLVFDVIGSPKDSEVTHITNQEARKFLASQSKKLKVPFHKIYPDASSSCWDLLETLLVFSPDKRCTVDEALQSSFLEQYYIPECNIFPEIPKNQFEFSFERQLSLTRYQCKEMIIKEVNSFRREKFGNVNGNTGNESQIPTLAKGRSQSNTHARPTPAAATAGNNNNDDNNSRASSHQTTTQGGNVKRTASSSLNNRSNSAPRIRPNSNNQIPMPANSTNNSSKPPQHTNNTSALNNTNHFPSKSEKHPQSSNPPTSAPAVESKPNHNTNNIDKLVSEVVDHSDSYDVLFPPEKKPSFDLNGSAKIEKKPSIDLNGSGKLFSTSTSRPQTAARLSIDDENILSKYEKYQPNLDKQPEQPPPKNTSTKAQSTATASDTSSTLHLQKGQLDRLNSMLPQPSTMETIQNPTTALPQRTTSYNANKSPGKKTMRLNPSDSNRNDVKEDKGHPITANNGSGKGREMIAERKTVNDVDEGEAELRKSFKQSKDEKADDRQREEVTRKSMADGIGKTGGNAGSNALRSSISTTDIPSKVTYSPQKPKKSLLQTYTSPKKLAKRESDKPDNAQVKAISHLSDNEDDYEKDKDFEEVEERKKTDHIESEEDDLRQIRRSGNKYPPLQSPKRASAANKASTNTASNVPAPSTSFNEVRKSGGNHLRSLENKLEQTSLQDNAEDDEADLKSLRAKYSDRRASNASNASPITAETNIKTTKRRQEQNINNDISDNNSVGSASYHTTQTNGRSVVSTIEKQPARNDGAPPAIPPSHGIGATAATANAAQQAATRRKLTVPKSPKFSKMSWQRRHGNYEEILQNMEKNDAANERKASVGAGGGVGVGVGAGGTTAKKNDRRSVSVGKTRGIYN